MFFFTRTIEIVQKAHLGLLPHWYQPPLIISLRYTKTEARIFLVDSQTDKWGRGSFAPCQFSSICLLYCFIGAVIFWPPKHYPINIHLFVIILICINLLNASLSFYEANKAGNAVEALKNSLKPTAIVKRDGVWDHRTGFLEKPNPICLPK